MHLSVQCSRCNFPVSTTGAGQRVSCPYCGETGVVEAITSDRRYGNPRTDEERRERHQERYGSEELPSRGTGLQARISGAGSTFLALLIGLGIGTAFGPEIMLASKWGRDTIRKKLTEKP